MQFRSERVLRTGRKKSLARIVAAPNGAGQAEARCRHALDFRVDGDVRFISHNDTVRMFARACARAGLPLSYSQGFNPRARVSLPFPRPVGQSSDVERVLIDLTQPLEPADLLSRLATQMPGGITLTRAMHLAGSASCQPIWVRYQVNVAPGDLAALSHRAGELLSSESIEITRRRHKDKSSRMVNIRPYIDAIDVRADAVFVSVWLNDSGSASPLEVCQALGIEADAASHLVRRVDIQWQDNQTNLQAET